MTITDGAVPGVNPGTIFTTRVLFGDPEMAKRKKQEKKTPIKSTPDQHSKHLSMRTLRRLFHNKKTWSERGFVEADSLRVFAQANAKRLRTGVETLSPKVESLVS